MLWSVLLRPSKIDFLSITPDLLTRNTWTYSHGITRNQPAMRSALECTCVSRDRSLCNVMKRAQYSTRSNQHCATSFVLCKSGIFVLNAKILNYLYGRCRVLSSKSCFPGCWEEKGLGRGDKCRD